MKKFWMKHILQIIQILYKLKREAKSKSCKLAINNIIEELLYESHHK